MTGGATNIVDSNGPRRQIPLHLRRLFAAGDTAHSSGAPGRLPIGLTGLHDSRTTDCRRGGRARRGRGASWVGWWERRDNGLRISQGAMGAHRGLTALSGWFWMQCGVLREREKAPLPSPPLGAMGDSFFIPYFYSTFFLIPSARGAESERRTLRTRCGVHTHPVRSQDVPHSARGAESQRQLQASECFSGDFHGWQRSASAGDILV